jgi:acyl dehydratase
VAWVPPAIGARASWTRTFTAAEVEAFATISGDRNPLHFDEAYASATGAGGVVRIGDTVTAEPVVVEARADKPITRLRCVARRADGTEVLRGECLVYTMLPLDAE